MQSTFPGARAPHVQLAGGRSTLDLFGRGFVLLRLGREAPDVAPFVDAVKGSGVPFEVVLLDEPTACALYEKKLVLVRPDGHVAWRGDGLPADADEVMARVSGAI